MKQTNTVNAIELNNEMQSKKHSLIFQEIGIFLFLFSIVTMAITIATCSNENLITFIVMFAVSLCGAILVVYKYMYTSVVLTALQIIVYTIYTIYQNAVYSRPIPWQSYIWIIVPLICVGGFIMFFYHSYKIEQINHMVSSQLSEIALLDSLTGLYNQRALYIDLQRQIAYVTRYNTPICLMVIQLRYTSELKSVLSANSFNRLVQRLGSIIEDNARLEERCYSTNSSDGSFAVMIYCKKEGALIFKNRVKLAIENKDAFKGITEKAIKVEVKFGICEYDSASMQSAIEFKQKTDNELQYDV